MHTRVWYSVNETLTAMADYKHIKTYRVWVVCDKAIMIDPALLDGKVICRRWLLERLQCLADTLLTRIKKFLLSMLKNRRKPSLNSTLGNLSVATPRLHLHAMADTKPIAHFFVDYGGRKLTILSSRSE